MDRIQRITLSPTWSSTGDFKERFTDVPLNRWKKYTNTSPTSLVKNVEVLGYKNGNYQAVVSPRSKAAYVILDEALLVKGFPKQQVEDRYSNTLRFHASDKRQIAYFLQTILDGQLPAEDINAEIHKTLGVTVDSDYQLPQWIKTGNFNLTFDQGTPLRRQEKYICTSQSSMVREIFLGGYRNGSYQISITPKSKDGYGFLNKALQAGTFPEQCEIDSDFNRIRLRASDKTQIALIVQTLLAQSSELLSLKAQFEETLGTIIPLKDDAQEHAVADASNSTGRDRSGSGANANQHCYTPMRKPVQQKAPREVTPDSKGADERPLKRMRHK